MFWPRYRIVGGGGGQRLSTKHGFGYNGAGQGRRSRGEQCRVVGQDSR
jgi:hypothetical protein